MCPAPFYPYSWGILWISKSSYLPGPGTEQVKTWDRLPEAYSGQVACLGWGGAFSRGLGMGLCSAKLWLSGISMHDSVLYPWMAGEGRAGV